MFATRNPVVLNTKQIEVNVRPIPPANNGNWWLPAESVKLYAEWSPQRPVFKVGEAVSRTVYLKAVGVVENQLPDIKFRDVAGLKQYPENRLPRMRLKTVRSSPSKKPPTSIFPIRPAILPYPRFRSTGSMSEPAGWNVPCCRRQIFRCSPVMCRLPHSRRQWSRT